MTDKQKLDDFDKEDFLIFRGSEGCSCEVDKDKMKVFLSQALKEQRGEIRKELRSKAFISAEEGMCVSTTTIDKLLSD